MQARLLTPSPDTGCQAEQHGEGTCVAEQWRRHSVPRHVGRLRHVDPLGSSRD